ncbi:MAG TPA: hypothetical protein V6C98_15825, partial [Thermosynechococcaceae cyanobacterium]
MNSEPIWVSGATRSGKTTYLVNQFRTWIQSGLKQHGTLGGRSTGTLNGTTARALPPLPSASLHSSTPPLVSFFATPEGIPGVLVLAAIGDNRIELVDRLTAATQGKVS